MSSIVPEGWQTLSLSEGIDILSGYPFASSQFTNDSSKTGLIRIRDLVNQNIETYFDGVFDDNYLIRKGDVLIGMDGDFNIVKWDSVPSLLNQRICKVTVVEEVFNLAYLYQDLQKDLLEINNQTGSTTVKHLSVKDIRSIHKPYPPLPEQKKIASILTSVDEVIENTQKQIDKLQNLKKATMNELLTKGIGHTEFKDSELGRIPKSWLQTTIGKLAKVKRGASPRPIQDPKWWGGSVGWTRISDVTSSTKYLNNTQDYLSSEGVKKSVRIDIGEVILSICATIGRPIIVNSDVCIHDGFVWFEGLSDNVDREFYYYTLCLKEQQLASSKQTGTQGNLNTDIVSRLKINLPPLLEQKKITSIITSMDKIIEENQRKLAQTQSLKKSLMQDLLTGKVRVTVN